MEEEKKVKEKTDGCQKNIEREEDFCHLQIKM